MSDEELERIVSGEVTPAPATYTVQTRIETARTIEGL